MSNPIIYRFTLDMQKSTSNVFCFVQQGDTASRLEITLNENGEPMILTEGTTAILCGLKSDGALLYNTATVDTTNNKIVYQFNTQTANVVGLVACQIKLTISGAVKSSPLFRLDVQNNAIDESSAVEESKDDINVLTGYIALIAAALENHSFDGYSPEISVTRGEGTTILLIKNPPGVPDARAVIWDGEDGADGFSPTATVTKSGSKTTISITDKNGTTSAIVNDGAQNITQATKLPPAFASENGLYECGEFWIYSYDNGRLYCLVSVGKDSSFSPAKYHYLWRACGVRTYRLSSAPPSTEGWVTETYNGKSCICRSRFNEGDIYIHTTNNNATYILASVTEDYSNERYIYTWKSLS